MPETLFVAIVATFNFKALGMMSRAKVWRDSMGLAALKASVIGIQEAGWADRYIRSLWAVLSPRGPGEVGQDWSHSVIPGESCAISYDQDVWEPIDSADRLLLHPGKKGVCEDRYYLAQDMRHRDSGVIVRIVSAHWAPRRAGLGLSVQKIGNATMIREITRTLLRSVPIIVLADFNQTGHPLGRTVNGCPVSQTSGNHLRGIDKIVGVAPPSHAFVFPKAGRRVEARFNSDHDAVVQAVHYRTAA